KAMAASAERSRVASRGRRRSRAAPRYELSDPQGLLIPLSLSPLASTDRGRSLPLLGKGQVVRSTTRVRLPLGARPCGPCSRLFAATRADDSRRKRIKRPYSEP